jgi:hypothetical protein
MVRPGNKIVLAGWITKVDSARRHFHIDDKVVCCAYDNSVGHMPWRIANVDKTV